MTERVSPWGLARKPQGLGGGDLRRVEFVEPEFAQGQVIVAAAEDAPRVRVPLHVGRDLLQLIPRLLQRPQVTERDASIHAVRQRPLCGVLLIEIPLGCGFEQDHRRGVGVPMVRCNA